MSDALVADNSHLDDGTDEQIARCVDLTQPRSFFLFAGAGSGKTRSLINAINVVREKSGDVLRRRGQKIGIVTYTNAACDEIVRRAEFDPVVQVSTIHSFAWALIQGFDEDIRRWLANDLARSIAELRAEEAKGRPGTKASATRLASIASKERRLQTLPTIRKFIYSPTGDNRTRDSLNHAEVLGITAAFLTDKPTLRKVVVSRFPFIFIDECQDTNKALVDAMFALEQAHRGSFGLGLLGDTMQRIYSDGKANIEGNLPGEWAKPAKQLNHRCPKRVVQLINRVRSSVDRQEQTPRTDSPEGIVRFFCLPADTPSKPEAEAKAAALMAEITGDEAWKNPTDRKTLILEHHMAATRMGFTGIFGALAGVGDFRTGLLDGTLPATSLFAKTVLPFINAHRAGDKFALGKIVRDASPLLRKDALKAAPEQKAQLDLARKAADLLAQQFDGKDPTLREIASVIAETGLFAMPEIIANVIAKKANGTPVADAEDEAADPLPERVAAIEVFLECPFSEIGPYAEYVSGNSAFDTHQGVKGLEFPRVLVVIDDTDARGFMFSYDKLFSAPHVGNDGIGDKESTADRTRRLFYVTCSRARESLAIVGYAAEPRNLARQLEATGWFERDEIVLGI
ncbi:UvrD-helicase domain-containing protein [Caulobacter sp. Root1472]|uniref:UvrD-helicase domain-containing protein n=1 Tax=Caulobacter sp. Root1472 TaxID=1736470 RepID=UPI0006F524DD|nr:UvrD-helicase domain-containing protein [Caulobacter sp. Root1472]KQZ31029.1 Fis family transcriptional regulator [Caulobacter sp. Root1472]